MFPPSVFATPRGSFNVPVPAPGQDPGACPLVTVTFSEAWLPYVLGALDQLVLQATWQGDDDTQTTAQQQAMYLKSLFALAPVTSCNPPQEPQQNCCDGDDDMGCCFRIQDNKLQQFCCGDWQTVLDLNTLSGGQPGPQPDSPQPGGPAVSTCYTLSGPGTAFLPWKVSTGDTLLLSNPSGAVNDQVEHPWRGPSGQSFVNNQYVQFSEVLNSTDRLPTAHHETVIISFDAGATWHNLWNGDVFGVPQIYTVPSGVSGVQPLIAVNVPSGTILAGSYGFCVAVTNNGPSSWHHHLDYTTSSWGFADASTGGGVMTWVPGVGWQGSMAPGVDLIIKNVATGSYTVTRGILLATDSVAPGGTSSIGLEHPLSTGVAFAAPIPGTSINIDSGVVAIGPSTDLVVAAQDNAGTITITEVYVEGFGPDPFPGAPG